MCGHCKALEPKWEEAATKTKGKARFGKVDASVQKGLQERYEITTFPILMVFHDAFDYGNGKQDQKSFPLPHTGQTAKWLIEFAEDKADDLIEESKIAAEKKAKKGKKKKSKSKKKKDDL